MTWHWRLGRDGLGIPHCWGATLTDLAYAQGWAAGYDRAWQIEVERRRGEAEAAAVLGDPQWDRFAAVAGLPAAARAAVRGLDEGTHAWLAAYVAGVNDGLPEGADRTPEFAATGLAPGRWDLWSPAAVFLSQHVLMGSFGHQLWRRHVRSTLGEEALDLLSHEGVPLGGSNAWALTGSRTSTGRPMIAADPHRVLEAPGIYQQVRLSTPAIDVVGLTFPGVPGVAHFGHTGSVAWAVTHAMADYQEAVAGAGGMPRLASPALADGDIGLSVMRRLLLARSVEDVDAALQGWVEPVNAVLIAGADGRVRERVAGRMLHGESAATSAVPPARRDLGEGEVVVHANDRRPEVARLGEQFAPPHRARRITGLLAEREVWDRAGLEAIQVDTFLGSWPTFRALLERVSPPAGTEAAHRVLLGWDGRMDAESRAAALFATWRTEFVRAVAGHPLLVRLGEPHGLPALFAPWLDPIARVGAAIERIIDRAPQWGLPVVDLAARALSSAATDDSTWGVRHAARFVRTPEDGLVPEQRPLAGDGDCVLATSATPGIGDRTWRGPTARVVWSFGGPSSWVVPLGADGPPNAPHAHDQHEAWHRGRQFTVTGGTHGNQS